MEAMLNGVGNKPNRNTLKIWRLWRLWRKHNEQKTLKGMLEEGAK